MITSKNIAARHSFSAKRRIFILVATIAVTDYLIFKHAPGFNLFLLSILLSASVLVAARQPLQLRTAGLYLGLSTLAAAPLLEAPSLIGFVIAMTAATLVSLASANLLPKGVSAIPVALIRFIPVILIRLPESYSHYLTSHRRGRVFNTTLKSLGGWVLPLGLGVIFLLLFSAANPLIEMELRNIDLRFLLNLFDIRRITLWLIAALVIWALIRPRLIRRSRRRIPGNLALHVIVGDVLDHAAIVRCLLVFNLLFALQTVLDLMYLWGGLELPAGMSHAEYAHRGAYPLVATALLAAAFVLIAMRRGGPGDQSPLIRTLVIAWIVQNVLLCLSSILRLQLYVEAYALTGLRIAAGVWMGLVAAGLVLILLRIALHRSNQWLIAMNLVTLTVVLYLCAFFDASGFIARFNVENCMRADHHGEPLDLDYLASLGPTAIPALDVYLTSLPPNAAEHQIAERKRQQLAQWFEERPRSWRSWSFRDHRLESYLRVMALIER